MSIKHEPIIPPRPNHTAEHVFLAVWQRMAITEVGAYNDDDQTHFDRMFLNYRWEPGQREATVAASIMRWMGTNGGYSLIEQARQVSKMDATFGGRGFVAAWAAVNERRVGVNGGIRVLEHVLTLKPTNAPHHPFSRDVDWRTIEELSGRDYETAECVMQWLDSTHGTEFLRVCATAIHQKEGALPFWASRRGMKVEVVMTVGGES